MLGKMRAAPEQGRGNLMADQDFAEAEREAGTQAAAQSATLFETAAQLLRFNIEQGHLYPSLVLQESGLSERLNMSRATVKRALAILEAEGLISKFAGRGFIVSGGIGAPRRDDLRRIFLDLEGLDEMVGKPNWLRIYEEVERTFSHSLIFGRYRIIEALLAEDFDVSRTVVRDVLGRLQERGLVHKSQTSRWVVEPLTSQRIKDKFELRTILETAALRSAKLDTAALRALVADINALDRSAVLTPATWFALEERFFRYAILSTPNQDLAESAQANRRALAACQSALFSLGLPPDSQSLAELGTVIDLALSGTVTAATSMLATHLTRARDRTIAQLKITAIIDPPSDLPRYLQRA